jgi:hypothetical protein
MHTSTAARFPVVRRLGPSTLARFLGVRGRTGLIRQHLPGPPSVRPHPS